MSKHSKINAIALEFQRTGLESDFNKIYEQLYYPILNFYKNFLLNFFKYNPEVAYREAPDVANEAFVRAYTKIDQFNPMYQFTTWIYTIAKNLCLHKIKKYKKRKHVSFDFTIPSFAEEGKADSFGFGDEV